MVEDTFLGLAAFFAVADAAVRLRGAVLTGDFAAVVRFEVTFLVANRRYFRAPALIVLQ